MCIVYVHFRLCVAVCCVCGGEGRGKECVRETNIWRIIYKGLKIVDLQLMGS